MLGLRAGEDASTWVRGQVLRGFLLPRKKVHGGSRGQTVHKASLRWVKAMRFIRNAFLILAAVLLVELCVRASEETFSIATLSDLHITDKASTALLNGAVERINALPDVRLTVVLGDISNEGQPKEYGVAKKALDCLARPYVVVPGNHDGVSADYVQHFGPPRWVREEGGWFYIGIDSSDSISSATIDWLKGELQRIPAGRPVALFLHHTLSPLLRSRVGNAEEVLSLFSAHDLKLVAAGHTHMNSEGRQSGVLFTTNACCSVVRENDGQSRDKGFRLFHFSQRNVETVFVPVRLTHYATMTALGWVTIVAYLVAATTCACSAWRIRSAYQYPSPQALLWLGLAFLLLVLGMGKLLGIQPWLVSMVRRLAETGRWYAERREIQAVLTTAFVLSGLFVTASLLWLARNLPRSSKFAIVGVSYLLGFIVVRATSYHYIDVLLGLNWHSLTLNAALENAGILWVALSALSVRMEYKATTLSDSKTKEPVVHQGETMHPGGKHEPTPTQEVNRPQTKRMTGAERRRAILQNVRRDHLDP